MDVASCGDGVEELREECDDGNTASGDGCSLGLCAESLDEYPSPSGNAGCFRTEHDAAADALLRAQYGY